MPVGGLHVNFTVRSHFVLPSRGGGERGTVDGGLVLCLPLRANVDDRASSGIWNTALHTGGGGPGWGHVARGPGQQVRRRTGCVQVTLWGGQAPGVGQVEREGTARPYEKFVCTVLPTGQNPSFVGGGVMGWGRGPP